MSLNRCWQINLSRLESHTSALLTLRSEAWSRKQTVATFDLQSLHHPIHVAVHYELDGPTRRKWLEVRNQSSHELLLLDVQIDDFALKTLASEGGHGEPVFFDEGFCALEHPTGVNQGDDGRV